MAQTLTAAAAYGSESSEIIDLKFHAAARAIP